MTATGQPWLCSASWERETPKPTPRQPGQGTPEISPPWLAGLVTYPHPAHVTQLILVSHGVFQDLEE